jgi:hypothetical protein
MLRLRVIPGLSAVCLLATAQGAAAQEQTIADIISFLLTNRSIVTDDFQRDASAALATRDALAHALQVELATLPIGSSSGGFTYRFNPALGTSERTSDAFGPFFVERALTGGRERASLGFSVRYARFDRLDGTNLRDGSLVTTANIFTDEQQPFDREALTLRLRSTTYTVFGSVGLADRLDVGFAVPVVSLDVAGERVNVFRGQETLQARASASVVGLADTALRAKYHIVGERGSGLAAGVEVRLPTGKQEDLLGTGETAVKAMAIASVEGPRVAGHGNLAYTAGGISGEIDFAGGVTFAAAARFTLIGEIVGRSIDELGRLEPVARPHPTIQGVNTIRLVPDETATRTAFVVAGFKWNVASSWLLTGNVLVPVTDRGLRAQVIPAIAIDYSFGR